MAWKDTLDLALGRTTEVSRKAPNGPPPPIDDIDTIDKTPPCTSSVNIVNFVGRPQRLKTDSIGDQIHPKPEAPPIPPLGEYEHAQAAEWPKSTLRVWGRITEHFMTAKGYLPNEALALAYATVRELQKRKGNRGLCLVSDLAPELGQAVGLALEVFPGARAEWKPKITCHMDG